MELDWREVSVTVESRDPQDKRGLRMILAPCSGSVKVGRMVAVMGPSGSGKTTLLTALRQEMPHQGIVRYDGKPFSGRIRQMIAFCEQEDVLIGSLDCYSYLSFYAQMQYGINSPKAKAKVEDTLLMLKLDKCRQTLNDHLSGGEKKRLCFARELMADPKLFFCDEPTSGLDAAMAYQVTGSLRRMCDSSAVSVLSSIHQPSTKIFEMFDDLILIRKGEMLYFGPASQVEHIFSTFGPKRQLCHSIAEYVMDFLVKEEDEVGGMTAEMREQFMLRASRLTQILPALNSDPYREEKKYRIPVARQCYLLFFRSWRMKWAQFIGVGFFIQHTLEMIIAGMAWCQLGFIEADVYARFSILNWVIGHWVAYGIQMHQNTWVELKPQLEKEVRSGWFTLDTFFFSYVILMIPIEIIWPVYWSSGIFLIARMDTDFWVWAKFILLACLTDLVYQAFSYAITSFSCNDNRHSRQLVSSFSLILMHFSMVWTGFYCDPEAMPPALQWVQYLNPLWHAVTVGAFTIFPDAKEIPCDHPGADHTGCVLNGAGALVLRGDAARIRHNVRGQLTVDLSLKCLIATLFICWLLGYIGLMKTLRQARLGAPEMAQEKSTKPTLRPVGGDPRHLDYGDSSYYDSSDEDDSTIAAISHRSSMAGYSHRSHRSSPPSSGGRPFFRSEVP